MRKCPYCDFNSHEPRASIPEAGYVEALLRDLDATLPAVWGRRLESIFIGGGTPSLFSPEAIDDLLSGIRARLAFRPDIEVTLEANPGTVEHGRFRGYREAGVNRLSLGIQSFDTGRLAAIGRIHDAEQARAAIDEARAAGFENLNLDLMFGLPGQSLEQGLADLREAIAARPAHISWYQLTLEPNTRFAASPPGLPHEDIVDELFVQGRKVLETAGYTRYEISAYAMVAQECRHNRNYWEFGDYIGLGAGAHGKLTDVARGTITRTTKPRHPEAYLRDPLAGTAEALRPAALPFEFMLNALRLAGGVPAELYPQRTGLKPETLAEPLAEALVRGLLVPDAEVYRATDLGLRFLNDLLELFLDSHDPAH